jgi:hypothetical protein
MIRRQRGAEAPLFHGGAHNIADDHARVILTALATSSSTKSAEPDFELR